MTISPEQNGQLDTVSIAADIVAAYVSNNPVPVGDLPKLIGDIHAALQGIGTPATEPAVKQEPAVSIRKSVTPDFILPGRWKEVQISEAPSRNALQSQPRRIPAQMELAR